MKKYPGIIALIVVAIAIIAFNAYHSPSVPSPQNEQSKEGNLVQQVTEEPATAVADSHPVQVVAPIKDWQTRITKKPFGLFVSPQNSPVSPERFFGYHTGVDFETTEEEQGVDVAVYVICNGPMLQKRTAAGYGGIVVQRCDLDGQPYTIVYGHLKLSSVSAGVSRELKLGEHLGVLGKGYSDETDGERKHLHLGIHKGAMPSILGYVSKQNQLDGWVAIQQFLDE